MNNISVVLLFLNKSDYFFFRAGNGIKLQVSLIHPLITRVILTGQCPAGEESSVLGPRLSVEEDGSIRSN